jgi:hypothetical protein
MVDKTRRMFLGAVVTFALPMFHTQRRNNSPIVVRKDNVLDAIFTRVRVTEVSPPLRLRNGVCYVNIRDGEMKGHYQFPEVNHTHRTTNSILVPLYPRPSEDELLRDAYVLLARAAIGNPHKVKSPTHHIVVEPNDHILGHGGVIEVNVNSKNTFLFFEGDNGFVGMVVVDNTKIGLR